MENINEVPRIHFTYTYEVLGDVTDVTVTEDDCEMKTELSKERNELKLKPLHKLIGNTNRITNYEEAKDQNEDIIIVEDVIVKKPVSGIMLNSNYTYEEVNDAYLNHYNNLNSNVDEQLIEL